MKTSLKQQVFDLLASQGLGHAGQNAWAVCPLASPGAAPQHRLEPGAWCWLSPGSRVSRVASSSPDGPTAGRTQS